MPTKKSQAPVTPLAAVLRPATLDDIIGQGHLVGPGAPIRKMVDKGRFTSSIIWGPAGCGKTTIVRAAAHEGSAHFIPLNATMSGVADLKKVIKDADVSRLAGKTTLVFVDEIHRWNKAQQDVMLPAVEDGIIVLMGATTEKPKFAVNSTILSRIMVYEVKPLDRDDMLRLVKRVARYYKEEKGRELVVHRGAARLLLDRCSGDARKLITVMETIVEVLSDDNVVAVEHVEIAIPDKHILFDASGNEHFDLAHAYQQSIQYSKADDAIHWLALWLASGEDPAFICRRMLITAFEDCSGNPMAPLLAMAAHYTAERTGLPECMIPMAQATLEMAMSERNKSAYQAISKAMADIESGKNVHVPAELRAGTGGYAQVVPDRTYVTGWKRDAPAFEKGDG